jgi:hypothetical protein
MSLAFSLPDSVVFQSILRCFAYGRTGKSKLHHTKLFFWKDLGLPIILQKIRSKYHVFTKNKALQQQNIYSNHKRNWFRKSVRHGTLRRTVTCSKKMFPYL